MGENIKITAELSRTDVSALFFLIGEELTEERWQKLAERPISLSFDSLSKEDAIGIKLALIGLAAVSVDM